MFGVSRPALLWLLALFTLEGLVFYTQVADQIAPFYPANFDQTGYLNYTRRLLYEFQDRGWFALLKAAFVTPTASGPGLLVQGALLAIVGGPSRATLLTLNLLYFLALQSVLFVTVTKLWRSPTLAWTSIAIVLSLTTVFNVTGGIYDYRVDFAAFCLYGIWACAVLQSDMFRDTRLSLLAGAVAALLVWMRFIAIAYIVLVLAAFIAVLLVEYVRRAERLRRHFIVRRVRNLALSFALTMISVLPILVIAAPQIYEKYAVGHVLNEEKYIRAQELNLRNVIDHITYYPKSILLDHLGILALCLMGLIAAAALFIALSGRPTSSARLRRCPWRHGLALTFLACAVVVPVLVLTVNIAKSQVVGGIVIVPIILVVMVLCAGLIPRFAPARLAAMAVLRPWVCAARYSDEASIPGRMVTIARTGIVAIALGGFLAHATTRQHVIDPLAIEQITRINERIARQLLDSGIESPTLFVDRLVDYLFFGTIELAASERLHRPLKFASGPDVKDFGMFAVSRDEALALLSASDVVVLTDPVRRREAPYPMNTKISEYWDELWEWTRHNRTWLFTSDILGVPHHVFLKAPIRIEGLSGGWITRSGIDVEADAVHLQRWPFIVLRGAAHYDLLGGEPRPRAILVVDGRPGAELPARLRRIGNGYEIVIDARTALGIKNGPIRFHLAFDRHFVPSMLGINSDVRELVLDAPRQRELRALVSE